MTDSQDKARERLPFLAWAWLIFFVVFVVVIMLAAIVSVGAAEQLLLGWIYFLVERLPRASVDVPALVLGATCGVLFFWVLHVTLRWVLSAIQSQRADTKPVPWRLRSTCIVGLGVCLMFSAGTAMVGATHQFVWMITGRVRSEPSDGRPFLVVSRGEHGESLEMQKRKFKLIGLGLANYADVYYKALPPGGTMSADGRLMHGWGVRLLPYLSYMSGDFDLSKPWNEPPNDRLFRSRILEFQVEGVPQIRDAQGYGLAHVAANSRVMPIVVLSQGGDTDIGGSRLKDIADGTSNTFVIGEALANFKPWGHPANVRDPDLGLQRSPNGFGSSVRKGTFFVFADGSVRAISPEIDPEIFQRLGSPVDEEPSGN